jgi:hypothetical protein
MLYFVFRFTDWMILQEESLFDLYIEKILALINYEDKGISKAALSNFSMVLQQAKAGKRLESKVEFIEIVRKLQLDLFLY